MVVCFFNNYFFCFRSAFFFYCADARPKLRADQPSLTIAEVAKELGKRWETLPERARFEDMAAKDKERYEKVSYINLYALYLVVNQLH